MILTDEMLPDMRSINDAAQAVKLPVNFIRRLVLDGKIKAVQAGRKKYYVNMQSLIDYLNGETTA